MFLQPLQSRRVTAANLENRGSGSEEGESENLQENGIVFRKST